MMREEVHRIQSICLRRVMLLFNSRSLKQGVCVHSPIIKLGLQHHLYLNNNLLSLYAKAFSVNHARQFFDKMPCRDVVSWTAILSAYVNNRRHQGALQVFNLMRSCTHHLPNAFTFATVLRSCWMEEDVSYGETVHGCVVKYGLATNRVMASSLIQFYSKLGYTEEACKIFRCMGTEEEGDVVLWTAILSCLVQVGKWRESFRLYVDMIKAEVTPNEFTFSKILVACSFLGLKYGKLAHAHMIIFGVELNLVVKTALVDMYSRCQRMGDAIKASKLTPEFDVFLWTAIVSGFAHSFKFKEAVAAFQEMEKSAIPVNNFTYLSIMNVCSSILSLDLGRQIHSRLIMVGMDDDVHIANALLDMYMKCSCTFDDGLRVFREIKFPNVVSWTSLMAGFSEHGYPQRSLDLFVKMMATGVQPNSVTLSTILRACSLVNCQNQTLKLHGYAIKTNTDHGSTVNNALVDAYASSGRIDDAWNVMRNMNQRDVVTYTSLATRLNQTGHHDIALNLVTHMSNDEVAMDGFSLATFLSAATSSGATETGMQLHCLSEKSGLSNFNSVSNGLVDLYGKCGRVNDAQRAFEEMSEPDVVSWNGLIFGLASNGYVSSALSAFDNMRLAGIKPDSSTFWLVLFACCHGALFEMGVEYFYSIREIHDIEPQLDHYHLLIDILGRAGQLEEAIEVLETMPFKPNSAIYKTLLSACSIHRNVPLGEDMARRGLELDPSDPSFQMMLANLYHKSGRSDLGKHLAIF